MITTLSIITCDICKIKRKERGKKEDTYFNRKGGHEMSLIELIIVKVALEPLGVRYAIPPQLVLNIRH